MLLKKRYQVICDFGECLRMQQAQTTPSYPNRQEGLIVSDVLWLKHTKVFRQDEQNFGLNETG